MCDHKRLRTVGDRVFCCSCGKELDIAFLIGKNKPENQPDDEKQTKSTSRRTRAKIADKTA